MQSISGEMVRTYTKSGLERYQIEISHEGLKKYQVVRGDNRYIVQQKARALMSQWDRKWEVQREKESKAQRIQEKKEAAAARSTEAQEALAALENVLAHTLSVDDTVDWDLLKNRADYSVPRPSCPDVPREPQKTDPAYRVQLGILDWIMTSRRIAKQLKASQRYEADRGRWLMQKEEIENAHAHQLRQWEQDRDDYDKERDTSNAAIDKQRDDYLKGDDPQAIVDYCELVLSNSEYPDYFPQTYELDFNPETQTLIVDYQLPPMDVMPTLKEVRYIQSKDESSERHLSQPQINRLYNSLLYQIALRTIHELYEADQITALAAIVFNGYVDSIDPAMGQKHNSCILSVQSGKQEFERINLAAVEPMACFRSLKGISASKLHSFTPVAPILQIKREDSRFVSSYAVAESIEGENLAAMDWEDFEHLIRELFEKEFTSAGGEVRVTRASRDGGIDAVIFDPDPIRGGKIVVQAKRYTNTVGVSAVRDLYGTLINEGANKGILVSTSDYGPDAHEFAKGKPMTLLSGAQLLYLLEKHGHKARIDLKEAKKLLADQE